MDGREGSGRKGKGGKGRGGVVMDPTNCGRILTPMS